MQKLQAPSKKLATKILTEVGFDDRLIGFKLHERVGPISITMYSFEEVVRLLNDLNSRLDFKRLETWIRKVMRDEELGEKIAVAVEKDSSNQDKSWRICNLMNERLSQCKALSEEKS